MMIAASSTRIQYVLALLLVCSVYIVCTSSADWVPRHELELDPVNLDGLDLSGDPKHAAAAAIERLTQELKTRVSVVFERATTPECRSLIGEHFGYFIQAIGTENPFPFADLVFESECDEELDFTNLPDDVDWHEIQGRTYDPPRNETEYISPSEIIFCYGLLAHDSANATIRFIEAVNEPTTMFVVHVDAKYEQTYLELKEYSKNLTKVHVLDHPNRVRVNWGAFSMVNATLQMLNYVDGWDFTHFVHMASSAYPLASNARIRQTLADYPKDANFMHVIMKPQDPIQAHWNYFVECDDWVHRIHRLERLRAQSTGIQLYTTSQWFIISKEFASYLANPEPHTFYYDYLEYIRHVVVADESFFGTVMRHSKFCNKHHNWNFLHLQFDLWEQDRAEKFRDARKCIMPDPNHCGRSPTTMTMDYLDILELSGELFARKFSDEVDTEIKDAIDMIRAKEEQDILSRQAHTDDAFEPKSRRSIPDTYFAGHGVLFVAKDTVNSTVPLCLGLGPSQNKVRLVPCFYDWVIPLLEQGWEGGAVVIEETLENNRWEIGPCSSDGDVVRGLSGEMIVTPGIFTPTGPRCKISLMEGDRWGSCMDNESIDLYPSGMVHVYYCDDRWYQTFSFGNGNETPAGSIYTTVPKHVRDRISETGREQESYLCIGVRGRGEPSLDENDMIEKRDKDVWGDGIDPYVHEPLTPSHSADELLEKDSEKKSLLPISLWNSKPVVTTRCSNTDAIIEWVVVPFIDEGANEKSSELDEENPEEEKPDQ